MRASTFRSRFNLLSSLPEMNSQDGVERHETQFVFSQKTFPQWPNPNPSPSPAFSRDKLFFSRMRDGAEAYPGVTAKRPSTTSTSVLSVFREKVNKSSLGRDRGEGGRFLGRGRVAQIHMSKITTDLLPEPRIVSARTVASWDSQEPPIGSGCALADGSYDSSSAHGTVPSTTFYPDTTNDRPGLLANPRSPDKAP